MTLGLSQLRLNKIELNKINENNTLQYYSRAIRVKNTLCQINIFH